MKNQLQLACLQEGLIQNSFGFISPSDLQITPLQHRASFGWPKCFISRAIHYLVRGGLGKTLDFAIATRDRTTSDEWFEIVSGVHGPR
jgi:hypothetical protein